MRTVEQARFDIEAELAKNPPQIPTAYACFKSEVFTDEGVIDLPWRHNLGTTTAAGFTNLNDWLSKAMGAGCSTLFASAQGTLTGCTATVATNSGATFPTAGQGLAGQYIIVGANSAGAGSVVWGRILSNTSTGITVAQWYSGTSTSGAAGVTPSTTGQYIIPPGQAPAEWMAITASATTITTADTTLAGELTTNGLARAVGSWSHTAAANTYTLAHTWTCSGGAGTTINNEGIFGDSAGGVYPFGSPEPTPPSLLSGDTLQNTVTVTV